MKFSRDEIWIYCDENSSEGKKTVGYAKGFSNNVNVFDYSKKKFTPRIWNDLLRMLGCKAKDLLDKSNPLYQEKVKGRDFEGYDWINIIINNPELMRAPIAIKSDKAIICNTPTDVLKLDNKSNQVEQNKDF